MHGKNSLTKRINKVKKSSVKKSSIGLEPVDEEVSAIATTEIVNNGIDVGDWRIAQDNDGSLIIYNFATGAKSIISRP